MSSDVPQSDIGLRDELGVVVVPPEPAPEPAPLAPASEELEMPPSQDVVPLARIPRLEGLRHPPKEHDAGNGAQYSGIRRPLKARTFEPVVSPAPVAEIALDAKPAPIAASGPAPEPLKYPTKMRSFNQRVGPSAVARNALDVCPPPVDVATPILQGLADPRARSLEDSRAPAQFVADRETAVLGSADALKRAAPAGAPAAGTLSAETMRAIEASAAAVKVSQSVDVMLNVRHSDGGCLGVTIEKPASDAAVIRTFVCPAVDGACPSKRDASCHYVDMPIADEGALTM